LSGRFLFGQSQLFNPEKLMRLWHPVGVEVPCRVGDPKQMAQASARHDDLHYYAGTRVQRCSLRYGPGQGGQRKPQIENTARSVWRNPSTEQQRIPITLDLEIKPGLLGDE
jgi:hypothetical protein